MKNVVKGFDNFFKFHQNKQQVESIDSLQLVKEEVVKVEDDDDVEDWDWDRWMKYVKEIEVEEKTVSVLKAKLSDAIRREDYKDAAKLKVGIAAAAANDTVKRVISQLNKAVEEERFDDAAFIRDNAGVGLIGWWAGISQGTDDPYGRIIRINAEHGRYVARNYSPRQLATATPGAPLFEIFLTLNDKGEYQQLVVYLKRSRRISSGTSTKSKLSDPLNGLNEGKSRLSAGNTEDLENNEDMTDDSDLIEGLTSLIPDAKVKLIKVTGPVEDKGLSSKVVEQNSDKKDEEENLELTSSEEDDVESDNTKKQDEIVMDSAGRVTDNSDIVVKIVFGGLLQKLSNQVPSKDLIRVPARIENNGRLSFSFSINTDDSKVQNGSTGQSLPVKTASLPSHRSMDHYMSDMAKLITRREKIPRKALKDMGELIKLSLTQAQNRQTLSGSTVFNRIEIEESSDPLNGLYVGAHGIYTSEVIHLRRNFGQWQDDDTNEESPKLEFYEYVEALKLTGDPYVPAGQVAFRAKVGKQYQLPHKGIFPEELGVVARYRGQGRLAESGFLNPRWVDGELVIINSKYIKGGPVVGFVYWAESHFLVFFNRLRLPS